MIYWIGAGSAHLTFMKRKPTPIGICMRTLACGVTGVLLNCELCESKDEMGEKPFVKEWGKHTATTLRITRPWWYTGKVVVADSFFGSFRCAFALL